MSENETEFKQIYKTFRPRIARYLMRLGCQQDRVEDLVQDTFVKVSRGLKHFRGQSKLSIWIYRIATNTAFDWLRSPSSQREAQEPPFGCSVTHDEQNDQRSSTMGEVPSVETVLIREEMNDCILEFVNNLPENYRTVLLLSEREGFKNREIAEILRVTLDTVKIRLHRGRRKLKQSLEGGCDFYRDEHDELACDRKRAVSESSA
jgi:RNA polymerase sigma-70 factor (ECF subfamily)